MNGPGAGPFYNCYGEEIDLFGDQPKKWTGGYIATPGSGPAGETCGSCRHRITKERAKRYFKCGLSRQTNGAATDIRLKSPACSLWAKPENTEE